jgi:hypothetical protein
VWGSQGVATLDETRNKLFPAWSTLILTFSGGRDESRGNWHIWNRVRTPQRLPCGEQAADPGGLMRGVQKVVRSKSLAAKT